MRNVFQSIQPERVRPALALVNSSGLHDADVVAAPAGLSSGDAAAALGLDPGKSRLQLWREKTGRALEGPEVHDCPESSLGYWQTLLEPLMAAVYTKRTGHRLKRHNIVQSHPLHPWMQANFGWEVIGQSGVDLLECVGVGKNEASLWTHGLPAHVRINVMHTLAVTGKDKANLAVLMCGQELQIFHVGRDEIVIRKIIEQEQDFWRSVQRDEAPA